MTTSNLIQSLPKYQVQISYSYYNRVYNEWRTCVQVCSIEQAQTKLNAIRRLKENNPNEIGSIDYKYIPINTVLKIIIMADLSKKTKYLNIVIQQQHKTFSNQLLQSWCNENTSLYAFINHDKDIIIDNDGVATPKGLHTHVVAICLNADVRLSTRLNKLAKCLNIDNDAITIDEMKSTSGSIQYLIHKNDKEKYQYSKEEIITSLDSEELTTYLNAENDAITLDRLIQAIKDSKSSKIEIMRSIGLEHYTKYRNIINDIMYEIYYENKSTYIDALKELKTLHKNV